MGENAQPAAQPSRLAALFTPTSLLVFGALTAVVVYQMYVRPDEGPRTIRQWLANQ